ncbi:KpsF/GutQ family sugar-phosphate isomerase [Vibrio coralliilyticus]|jgi:arabinose-5-phosphate isomerase|uniref:KpsF/GutQ family sugar-phosphate isomerase n=1 Tax=Vibrio coralliilyticus TaxID=190893 RepID=UPI0006CD1F28|nr:KpsF/GutQ family sugar-phosphate isomerase [Vibrio coralliilyticus]AXN32308.1 KpsF/GutQ family sugar-phosphate isomerase [Vibrio coralliilyticus]KPH26171.1 D-arabinose 5-phosphate isomerase [Vibrio coralliilyticus]NOI31502.1 KpsF/GutQ family sugar-phosphate isomerase [Vibrio coralliilyticus]NOI50922.1 KpsF/GutQ family sugar-phosphate isomerase [Vibrio coralliilyticus]NOI78699.1 KpsF/GutQ family sugar-phosphate isomerase [Vibrio coralliilyticus]
MFDFRSAALDVLKTEIEALEQLDQYINDDFVQACELILANKEGKVAVMGMGKSGHIGNKIAASLASTGTSAFFVHPGEAAHGDLGMIEPGDIVLAISNSGESSEILGLFPVLKRLNIKIISMTGKPESNMAKLSDYHLQITVPKEACPLGLAPTASTTATLAMGDALAVALLQARGFTAEDFALSHPGGALGRKLLLKLSDIMHTGEQLPLVTPDTVVREALLEISQKGLGMTAVVDDHQHLVGIFTDGDLRRILDKRIDIHSALIGEVMTTNPTTASPNILAAEGLNLMQQKSINGLILCLDGKVVGALNMHDLLKAGVM